MTPSSVGATVEVRLPPDRAFEAFTAEIGAWYVVDSHTVADPGRTKTILIEPYIGGRLMDVHDVGTGDGIELARVTAWEPGARVAWTDAAGTEVDVTFTGRRNGTRVVLEHRGLDRVPPADRPRVARFGWHLLLPWYRHHLIEGAR